MRLLRYPAVLALVLALVALTAWLLSWSFEETVYLAPVIVLGGAALVRELDAEHGQQDE